jgi:hypothetical protein
MAAMTFDLAISAVGHLLQQKSTPICWLVGPSASGKTALVHNLLASTDRARVLSLSAASPDRCLQQVFNEQTTAGLFTRLSAGATTLLVLDALDAVQYSDEERLGQVFDLRLRLLLSSTTRKWWPELSILVTSRFQPPRDLQAEGVSVIELVTMQQASTVEPVLDAGADAILEVLASSRKASSGWLLGLLTETSGTQPSLATPEAVRKGLDEAVSAGLVHRVETVTGGEWFQMLDNVRPRYLPPARAADVHCSVADKLLSDQLSPYIELAAKDDPELRHDLLERAMVHLLEADETEQAVQCYWHQLGNFSRLVRENALHLGIRACSALNDGRPPRHISPALKKSPAAMAVINDWGVHAICIGDATLAAETTLAAYGLSTEDDRLWDRSMLACYTAEALLVCGRVPEAMEWAERAKQFARAGLRLSEGVPTQEIMSAYDAAFYAIMAIAAQGHDAAGVAQVLSDMVELHIRMRKQLEEFNRHSILPLPGPTGEVNPEELSDGKPAGLLALLEDRPGDAVRILTAELTRWPQARLESRQGAIIRTLLLRALLADKRYSEVRALIPQLQHVADGLDDTAARCELASLAANLALVEGDAAAALAIVDDFLYLASHCGLQLLRNDLLGARSRALMALGRVDEAKTSAVGIQDIVAAPAIKTSEKRPQPAKAPEEPRKVGPERRLQLHEAALKVIENYDTRGLPFAVYFRKYDITITHGPFEFGAQLTENRLVEAMPPGAKVLTIQDHGLMGYLGSGGFTDRSAPAFLLGDDDWKEVALALIRFADLIVHEPSMLGGGTRWELETIFQEDRWDRTVLLLLPLRGGLPPIDNDPLIQKFPRCIWMDDFHTTALPDIPVVQDLIARMAQIAALPEDARRGLTDRVARDAAYPIDLMPIARHYEDSAMLSSLMQDEDDRIRYYGFWQLFRAGSLRSEHWLSGDDSFDNRVKFAEDYIQMSAIMLDHESEGDKFILFGDLTFAEQCAESAYNLIRESDGPIAAYYRDRAEKRYEEVMTLRNALQGYPDRFILRPRYGPFPVSARPRDNE